MLKNLGIAAWIGCIMVIAFQAATWFFTASWPSVTLMDGLTRLGWNPFGYVDTLPVDLTMKALYVLLTTQLSVALWWLGAGLIVLAVAVRILFRK